MSTTEVTLEDIIQVTVADGTYDHVTLMSYNVMSSLHAVLLSKPVGIPPGSEIASADISFTRSNQTVGTDDFYVVDDVNPGPNDPSDLSALTVEPTLSIVTGTAGTRFSLDITSHLQTLVNKSGWTETSALKFLHTRSAGTARRAVSHLSDTDYPQITVEWSMAEPEPEPEPEPVTVSNETTTDLERRFYLSKLEGSPVRNDPRTTTDLERVVLLNTFRRF